MMMATDAREKQLDRLHEQALELEDGLTDEEEAFLEASLYERSDTPDVDARGQCYSDADPGL